MTAELFISDGTTTIDFVAKRRHNFGFRLIDWRQNIAGYKSGGIFQNSSLGEGQRLVDKHFANGTEVFTLALKGSSQDATIEQGQTLFRLLEQATDYWTRGGGINPVYIGVKADNESNRRYALIVNYRLAELPGPLQNPFPQLFGRAVYDEFTLAVERQHWTENVPGTGSAVSGSNTQIREEWQAGDTNGAVPDLPAPPSAYQLVAIGNNRLMAIPNLAGAGQAYISTSKGASGSWAAVAGTQASSIATNTAIVLSNGTILIGDFNNSNIKASTNDGDSVFVISSDITPVYLLELANGDILGIESSDNNVYISTDGGINWSVQGTVVAASSIAYPAVSPVTGTLVCLDSASTLMYRSADNGKTWAQTQLGTASAYMAVDSNGFFYSYRSIGSDIRRSTDDGLNFLQAATGVTANGLFVDSNDVLYMVTVNGSDDDIYISTDNGSSFDLIDSVTGSGVGGPNRMVEGGDGTLYVGENGNFNGFIYSDLPTVAFTSTDDRLDIANKQNVAQLTHIFVDDGGVFGSNQFPVDAAFDLLPNTPVVDDAVYFGVETAVSTFVSGPFCSLRFNISSGAFSTNAPGFTILWEYYNGSWVTLTTRDDTDKFQNTGLNSVAWKQPSDWTTVAVNGVTGYWVRARVSAIAGTMTGPDHANSPIFTYTQNYINIAAAQIGGDIPALARLQLTNRGDDGSPDMADNRVILGLRSVSRGSDFVAYLNCADEQNPTSITASAGTNVTFGADILSATGRAATYNPGGAESIAARVTFTINSTVAAQYYGIYHAFLRCRQDNGSAGDISVRLVSSAGSGGISDTGDTVALTTTNDHQLVDLGRVEIVPRFGLADVGDQLTLVIQASALSGTPNLVMYDLVLIPTDEWSADFQDGTNSASSDIGQNEYFDIDSVGFLKSYIRGVARDVGSDLIYSIYQPIANGRAQLINNKQQRLWFLFARYGAGGEWVSEPYGIYSVVMSANQRYLSGRGSR